MKKCLLLLAITTLSFATFSQATDSLLTNLRTMDWPLVNFKNQWQVDAGISLAVGNNGYNGEGQSYSLDDIGQTYTNYSYGINLSYGLLDYLELGLNIQHHNRIERLQPSIYFSALSTQSVSYIEQQKGFDDLMMSFRFKYPLTLQKYDLVLTSGLLLPLGGYGMQTPLHSYESDGDTEYITYNNIYTPGSGTTGVIIGGNFKYRFTNFAIELNYLQKIPLGDGDSPFWDYTFNGSGFDYSESTFDKHFPSFLKGDIFFEYQVSSFFSGIVGYRMGRISNGWEQLREKMVAIPEQTDSRILIGANLIASSGIWYRQELSFAVSGKNMVTPFRINSIITFNRF